VRRWLELAAAKGLKAKKEKKEGGETSEEEEELEEEEGQEEEEEEEEEEGEEKEGEGDPPPEDLSLVAALVELEGLVEVSLKVRPTLEVWAVVGRPGLACGVVAAG
jgi:hypothetical protein